METNKQTNKLTKPAAPKPAKPAVKIKADPSKTNTPGFKKPAVTKKVR